MDANGNNLRRLNTEITNTPLFADLTWSPDGKRIAYVTPQDIHTQLFVDVYVMDANGSNNRRLTELLYTDTGGGAAEPAWSPDGTQIIFVSDREGKDEIYLMNADGSNQHNLTNNPARDSSPTWHPETKRGEHVGSPHTNPKRHRAIRELRHALLVTFGAVILNPLP